MNHSPIQWGKISFFLAELSNLTHFYQNKTIPVIIILSTLNTLNNLEQP